MTVEQSAESTAHRSRFAVWVEQVWTLSLFILWASWWGGLNFYALVVVPIGTEVLSSVGQGFITQQVTVWHNGLTAILICVLLCEAYRRRSKTLGILAGALVPVLIGLVVWHARLTGMMNFAEQNVPSNFYAEHAIYLWITAAEWLLGIPLPLWLMPKSGRDPNLFPRPSTSSKPSNDGPAH